MSERTYDSKCIAFEHLEEALRMYLDEKSYFAAITLAGAAEEILGKLAKHERKQNSIESLKNAACQIHEKLSGESIEPSSIANRANYARNLLKHVNPGLEPFITIDLEEEAWNMLSRAIENYWIVMEDLSPTMERFHSTER